MSEGLNDEQSCNMQQLFNDNQTLLKIQPNNAKRMKQSLNEYTSALSIGLERLKENVCFIKINYTRHM